MSVDGEGAVVEGVMVEGHLLDVGLRPLVTRTREVRREVVESGHRRPDKLGGEGASHRVRGGLGPTSIVVEEHERDVVPVLRLPSRASGRCLGEQIAGEPGDVDDSTLLDAADAGTQLSPHDIPGGDAGSSEVDSTERSQPSNRSVTCAGWSSRSASNSNFSTALGVGPSAIHRQTRSLSGSNSALSRTCSRRRVFTDPQAISRFT